MSRQVPKQARLRAVCFALAGLTCLGAQPGPEGYAPGCVCHAPAGLRGVIYRVAGQSSRCVRSQAAQTKNPVTNAICVALDAKHVHDVESDPWELENVVSEPASQPRVESLMEQLRDWSAKLSEPTAG